jgi:S1-C subfamily serine protease
LKGRRGDCSNFCQSNWQKETGRGRACDSFEEGNIFMQRGILGSFGSLIGAIVCVSTTTVSAAAQEAAPTQPGVITTFAPIVEKVAPSVVTVFTTQTVSRTQSSFPFSDDALRQFFGGELPQQQGKQTLHGLG